jgi:hypothetical protein
MKCPPRRANGREAWPATFQRKVTNMSNDSPPDTLPETAFETIVIAWRDAADPAERRMYLRAVTRRLAHDAALLAKRLELVRVATEGGV